MYNPDFWEVQLDQSDLEMMPDDVGLLVRIARRPKFAL